MNRTSLLLLTVIGITPWATAADVAKPGLPEKAVPHYQLKNKSSFALKEVGRSPFTPIGWKPASGATAVAVQKPTADEGMFRVSSILIGSPSLAVINGRSYEEGQMIRMPKTGPQVRAKLYRIGDGGVQIQVENEIMSVPLRRGELNEKRPDETLSSEKE